MWPWALPQLPVAWTLPPPALPWPLWPGGPAWPGVARWPAAAPPPAVTSMARAAPSPALPWPVGATWPPALPWPAGGAPDPCAAGHLIAETGREDIYILLGPPDHHPIAYVHAAPRSLDPLLGTRVRVCGPEVGRYKGVRMLSAQHVTEL